MIATPKHNITADRAMDLIMSGQPLNDVFVTGELKLVGRGFDSFKELDRFEGIDGFDNSLIATNCIFEYLSAVMIQFSQLIKFSNCELRKCDFAFSYFFGGLEITNCVFDNYLDFQAGGHNKKGKAVSINNNTFKGFVNFFDCWYESEFIIRENDFQKGTNILGKPNAISVTFDVSPIIENNKGQLDLDSEGDLESKAIYLR